MGLTSYLWKSAPFMAMITVECTDVGLSVISKAALTRGMSNFVSVLYSNALGTLILLPCIIFCRNKRTPLTFSLLSRLLFLGLIGSSGQITYLAGVKFSSPTLASALVNLIPIFTFVLAVITRMEKLDIRRSGSQAKVSGAVVSVSGAFVVTLYKGPPIILRATSPSNFPELIVWDWEHYKWIIGGLLIVLVCVSSAVWNVFQAAIVKENPDEMTVVFFFTFFITIYSAIFSLILETNPDAWKLKSDIEVIAIVCTAIFGSLFRIGIHTWCLREKGPLYVAMFKPLGIVVAVILSGIFLGDILHLGSAIGSIIIAVGFYTVMWGRTKEKEMVLQNGEGTMESSSQKTPLLQRSEIV